MSKSLTQSLLSPRVGSTRTAVPRGLGSPSFGLRRLTPGPIPWGWTGGRVKLYVKK